MVERGLSVDHVTIWHGDTIDFRLIGHFRGRQIMGQVQDRDLYARILGVRGSIRGASNLPLAES